MNLKNILTSVRKIKAIYINNLNTLNYSTLTPVSQVDANVKINRIENMGVKVFDNPVADRKQISSFLKGRSGVYLWLHKTNGKYYIGSSVELRTRFYDYFSSSYFYKSGNTIIANAISKYGLEAFKFIVLEFTEKEDALVREQYYISSLEPEYNILEIAGSTLGFEHSPETIVKLSKAATGRVLGEEIRERISDSMKNNNNNPGLSLSVKDLKTNIVTDYLNMTQAAKELGFSRTTISMGFIKNKETPFIVKGRYEITVKV